MLTRQGKFCKKKADRPGRNDYSMTPIMCDIWLSELTIG